MLLIVSACPATGKLSGPWQVVHIMPGRPMSASPRMTGGWWACISIPCVGVFPAGWQFTQRG